MFTQTVNAGGYFGNRTVINSISYYQFDSSPDEAIINHSGVLTFNETAIEDAIDSDWPLSSASLPGKAPAVSTKVTIGSLNLEAIFINLWASLSFGLPLHLSTDVDH